MDDQSMTPSERWRKLVQTQKRVSRQPKKVSPDVAEWWGWESTDLDKQKIIDEEKGPSKGPSGIEKE